MGWTAGDHSGTDYKRLVLLRFAIIPEGRGSKVYGYVSLVCYRMIKNKRDKWRGTVFIRILAGAIIYFEAYFPQKYFVNF